VYRLLATHRNTKMKRNLRKVAFLLLHSVFHNSHVDLYRVIKNLCAMKNSVYSNNPHKIDDLKMAITE
jgi:hypothetical protein